MPHTLPAILRHIAAQNRPQSHGAILLREIERLRAEVSELRAELGWAVADIEMFIRAESEPATKETTNV